MAEDGSSTWDVVSEDDVWGEGETEDDYVVVREEDIADGIACFMATYLSSLKQTKVHYTPPLFSYLCSVSMSDQLIASVLLCVGYIT